MENIQEKSPMLIVYQGLKMSETPIEGKKAIGIWVNGVIVFDEAPRKMGYANAKNIAAATESQNLMQLWGQKRFGKCCCEIRCERHLTNFVKPLG